MYRCMLQDHLLPLQGRANAGLFMITSMLASKFLTPSQMHTEAMHCLQSVLSKMFSMSAGLSHLSRHEGGKAVRCADEARSLYQSATKAAGLFDKAVPASLPADHAQFAGAFSDCITNIYNKVRLGLFQCGLHICSCSNICRPTLFQRFDQHN